MIEARIMALFSSFSTPRTLYGFTRADRNSCAKARRCVRYNPSTSTVTL